MIASNILKKNHHNNDKQWCKCISNYLFVFLSCFSTVVLTSSIRTLSEFDANETTAHQRHYSQSSSKSQQQPHQVSSNSSPRPSSKDSEQQFQDKHNRFINSDREGSSSSLRLQVSRDDEEQASCSSSSSSQSRDLQSRQASQSSQLYNEDSCHHRSQERSGPCSSSSSLPSSDKKDSRCVSREGTSSKSSKKCSSCDRVVQQQQHHNTNRLQFHSSSVLKMPLGKGKDKNEFDCEYRVQFLCIHKTEDTCWIVSFK